MQEAWPDDETDAFFAARDDAEQRLNEGDAELRAVAEAVVADISELASTAIRGSAAIGSRHLDFGAQNLADDRAMWQAGGAHHVAKVAVLAAALGDQLDEGASFLLQLPWLALSETSEDDRARLIAAAEEDTLEAFRAVAYEHILLREPDQPRTALVELLEPLDDREADGGSDSADDDVSYEAMREFLCSDEMLGLTRTPSTERAARAEAQRQVVRRQPAHDDQGRSDIPTLVEQGTFDLRESGPG